MKYNQPYGISDPEGPYINGNPSTGTMGSIPPAASVEYPQREIVNFIKDSAVTPDNADLRQLSKSVQSGKVTYALDAGTPNFIAITPTPAIVAYQIGMRFCIKAANANTGPTQVNVSNIGWQPLVHGDLSALGSGEVSIGQMIEVGWDGTHWQLLTGSGGGLIMMTAPRSLYVNATTGDDVVYDGSQAAVDVPNKHGPFKTLQHALKVMATYNLGGWDFMIYMANGTYAAPDHMCPVPNGSGYVWIIGNELDPTQVIITVSNVINTDNSGSLGFFAGGWMLNGLYLKTTLYVDGGQVEIMSMAFGNSNSSGPQILVQMGGVVIMEKGPLRVIGSGGTTASCFVSSSTNSIVSLGPNTPAWRATGAITYSGAFALVGSGGAVDMAFMSQTIDSGATVTGSKYSVSGNGILSSAGRGVSYFPGTVAGTVSTGGQYL